MSVRTCATCADLGPKAASRGWYQYWYPGEEVDGDTDEDLYACSHRPAPMMMRLLVSPQDKACEHWKPVSKGVKGLTHVDTRKGIRADPGFDSPAPPRFNNRGAGGNTIGVEKCHI